MDLYRKLDRVSIRPNAYADNDNDGNECPRNEFHLLTLLSDSEHENNTRRSHEQRAPDLIDPKQQAHAAALSAKRPIAARSRLSRKSARSLSRSPLATGVIASVAIICGASIPKIAPMAS